MQPLDPAGRGRMSVMRGTPGRSGVSDGESGALGDRGSGLEERSAPGGNRTRGLRLERPLLFGSPKRTVDH